MLDLMVFCMVQSTQNVNLSETFVSQTVQNLNDGDKIIWDSMLIENCMFEGSAINNVKIIC